MNSPDGRGHDPLDDAARSLRPRAPLPYEAVRAAARDFDAAIDAAARASAPRAPAGAWAALQAALRDGDAALDAAARAATPAAELPPFTAVRSRARRQSFIRRSLVLRGAVALAASLLVAALVVLDARRRTPVAESTAAPTLLSFAQLTQAKAAESRLAHEADDLEKRVTASDAAAASEEGQALLEELDFVEQALGECRDALAANELHPQMRRQLAELSEQRVELLRRLDAIPSVPPSGGGARG